MENTTLQELENIEVAVHEEFGEEQPTKEEVIEYLEKKHFPKMDGGASAAILVILKYAPIAALILSSWVVFKPQRKPPKCPEEGCGKRQVTVDDEGRSVCSNGHKWRL